MQRALVHKVRVLVSALNMLSTNLHSFMLQAGQLLRLSTTLSQKLTPINEVYNGGDRCHGHPHAVVGKHTRSVEDPCPNRPHRHNALGYCRTTGCFSIVSRDEYNGLCAQAFEHPQQSGASHRSLWDTRSLSDYQHLNNTNKPCQKACLSLI